MRAGKVSLLGSPVLSFQPKAKLFLAIDIHPIATLSFCLVMPFIYIALRLILSISFGPFGESCHLQMESELMRSVIRPRS